MLEISYEDYQVVYDPKTAVITCSGSFRLRGNEYVPIADILNKAVDDRPQVITLNVRDLKFLNSAGINVLLKFAVRVRKHNISVVMVRGRKEYPWQGKTLKNMQRLLPVLKLEIE